MLRSACEDLAISNSFNSLNLATTCTDPKPNVFYALLLKISSSVNKSSPVTMYRSGLHAAVMFEAQLFLRQNLCVKCSLAYKAGNRIPV